jgi:hypothetical protein
MLRKIGLAASRLPQGKVLRVPGPVPRSPNNATGGTVCRLGADQAGCFCAPPSCASGSRRRVAHRRAGSCYLDAWEMRRVDAVCGSVTGTPRWRICPASTRGALRRRVPRRLDEAVPGQRLDGSGVCPGAPGLAAVVAGSVRRGPGASGGWAGGPPPSGLQVPWTVGPAGPVAGRCVSTSAAPSSSLLVLADSRLPCCSRPPGREQHVARISSKLYGRFDGEPSSLADILRFGTLP